MTRRFALALALLLESAALVANGETAKPSSRGWHPVRRAIAGLIAGVLLAAASFAATGMGHGVYFVIAIVSAPFAVLGVLGALAATVAMAIALAALAGTRPGAMLLAAHYAGWLVVFRIAPGFADFERFGAMPAWLQLTAAGALTGYAVAQAWLIREALRAK